MTWQCFHKRLVRGVASHEVFACTCIIIVVATAVAPSVAQLPTPMDASTRTVPATVTGAGGQPVHGLTQQDFRVSGKGVAILSTEEVSPAVLPAVTGAAPQPGIYILFDELAVWPRPNPRNSPWPQEARVELLRFLAQSVKDNRQFEVLVSGPDGIGIVHRLSTPLPVLAAALQRVDRETKVLGGNFSAVAEKNPALVDEEAARLNAFLNGTSFVGDKPEGSPTPASEKLMSLQAGWLDALGSAQLGAMEQIASALRNQAGRKPLVWLTAISGWRSGITSDGIHKLIPADERIVEQLNEAGVSVYPVIVTGGGVKWGLSTWRDSYGFLTSQGLRNARLTFEGLHAFSAATGGKLLPYENGLASAVTAALRDCGPYYLVRLRVPSGRMNWTSLNLTVRRPGCRVQTRKEFWTFPETDSETEKH